MHKATRSLWLLAVITLLISILFSIACSRKDGIHKFAGRAQGTSYHISFWAGRAIDSGEIQQAVGDELSRIDRIMSGYRADSIIEQFNAERSSEPVVVGAEIVALIEAARAVNVATKGCYDPTIKPVFELWGFQSDYFTPPDSNTIHRAMTSVGIDKLRSSIDSLSKTSSALQVDLSSIAQGYSVAQVAAVLEQYGVVDYLVEIGGELVTRGRKPDGTSWRVAIEKPLPEARSIDKIVTIKQLQPLAIMTSGTYRHFFDKDGKRYSHILDARTGLPVEHSTVAVSVFFPDATAADAWSTALLCLGSEAGILVANQQGIPALFVDQNEGKLIEEMSRPLLEFKEIAIE